MTKFYVTIEEVVEKVVLIEVDTDNKKEAKDIYNGKKEGNMTVLSESEENGLGNNIQENLHRKGVSWIIKGHPVT